MERHKTVLEWKHKMVAMETDHEIHKGKLQTEMLALKNDHSEALHKQRETFELEVHKAAI